ncbi:MAG: hypothetical protein ABIG61_16880 [Planctomycetota bacterium]
MPFTPYHFGPSGCIAFALRKWLDVPVFLLANIIVDIEVLILRRHACCHTLLFGALAGSSWAVLAYLLSPWLVRAMHLLRIPYTPRFWKMLISGILGVWTHILIDAIYHWDVRIFYPAGAKPLWGLLTHGQLELVCEISFIPLIILYLLAVNAYNKNKSPHPPKTFDPTEKK